MKLAVRCSLLLLGFISIAPLFFGCRTLSTTAGSPPSGPVNGMLYYLPIGKITVKGEFKAINDENAGGGATTKNETSADAQLVAPPPSPPVKPGPDPGGEPGSTTMSAGQLTITLTSEVEADETAGEFYVVPHANYIYEDEERVTVNAKQLLGTGNVTTEDKTADIVGAAAAIAAQVRGYNFVPPKGGKIRRPFYFSFHPSSYDEYSSVRQQLLERDIVFELKPAPAPNDKQVTISAAESKRLGEKGLIFRPAIPYKITIRFNGKDATPTKTENLIDGTQQFILPDPFRLYEVEYPRMAFVKKVKEIGFTNGMLSDFHQKVPSPILGFLGIPKAVLQAMVPIPGAAGPSGSAAASGTTPAKN